MDWDDAMIATLINLVMVEKLHAKEIAKRLKVSRNAVIGKVHRLAVTHKNLRLASSPLFQPSKPAKPSKPRSGSGEARPKRGRHALVVRAQAAAPSPTVKWRPPRLLKGQVVTILNRAPWMCKWPTGRHGGMTQLCGKPRKDWDDRSTDETASPYCEDHHKASYQPTKAPAKPRPRPHFAKG